jgi:anaerobic ribonucleoside-triphosphate reductase activating protein
MMVHQISDPGCRQMSVINLAGFLARSSANGPGTRAVVWVQGCPIRCPGCFNEQFQSFSPAHLIDTDRLAERILSLDGIDGVTFSGGEPFAQAGALAVLGRQVRDGGLNVVTYSGYTCGELAAGTDPSWPALLAVTDLLIAGPYLRARACRDPLRGSGNQRAIPLGTRLAFPPEAPGSGTAASTAEFTIAPDGTIIATGFPAPALLRALGSPCRGA